MKSSDTQTREEPQDEVVLTRIDFLKMTPRMWAHSLRHGDAVERFFTLFVIVGLIGCSLLAAWGVWLAVF